MKKWIYGAAAFLALTLAACAQDAPPAAVSGGQPPSITMLDGGVWPENEYTDGLPVPAGTVSWAALDPAHGNCSVSIAGMGEADYHAYMDLLGQQGFSTIKETSEQIEGQGYVSIGTLLSDGERGLSISYAHDHFMIYISL